MKNVLTTQQAAMYLNVPEAEIRDMIRIGKVKSWSLPLEKGLLLRTDDLRRLKEERTVKTKDEGEQQP